ncbi:hypothetical protein [Haloprofundus salilacus]|uniref:hypothetical protein n=1 Tax=Haloprofundus salilacus TaxID=2876190 RepID=UPI001CCF54F4|nr:hypothetical protein [Haloprofundus salilacus]
MSRYEATFDINSKSDANAVRRLIDRMYDTLREESREIYQGDTSSNETLEQFKTLREAARRQSPGTLTIVYEQADESFDD